ncbi:hypothetical protein PHYSODRAFT_258466 [Phytophthora sojae]|uniref:Uncharacterized protein n=1 Tax=Phytophthora sojae (strain P6497) TaxID=1094619 RepID=G4YT90_PHYSP|nr:hypothetical protein PHYSODRAFT_258466 [Phytophthora sojae]EGZ26484.1 hypothetical protein PHYSODRAFT_258466 [Phytophthora sojae]|eukprot:XP_009521772.1 hypothetical protein PHYSODRAFT_258466 [Phytophthora sojae]
MRRLWEAPMPGGGSSFGLLTARANSRMLAQKSGQDADAPPPPEEKAPAESQLSTVPAREDAPPKSLADWPLGQDAAKEYVAAQVYRWEQVRSERVLPPNVEYTWPESRLATSKDLAARATLGGDVQPCVLELRLDRHDLATAQDAVAAEISVAAFTPRECVPILQTLLFEAGSQFDNLVPEWFKTHAYKIAPDLVRSLAGDIQTLEVEAKSGQTPALDYHAEDQDGDLLMNAYEVNLLGRNYVLRLRVAGIRSARSSSGSSAGEPTTSDGQPARNPLGQTPCLLRFRLSCHHEDIQRVRLGQCLEPSPQSSPTLVQAAFAKVAFIASRKPSGRTGSSISSGVAEAAVGALHQAQMLNSGIEKLREALAAKEKADQEAEVLRAFAEAAQRDVPVMSTAETVVVIQAASLQAARAERERVEAAAVQWMQQQTEADAKRESERAAQAARTQRDLEESRAVQAVMKQELENLRATYKNMQMFQDEQIRNLRATVADVQPDRATTDPDLAIRGCVIMGRGDCDRARRTTAEFAEWNATSPLRDADATRHEGARSETESDTANDSSPGRNL